MSITPSIFNPCRGTYTLINGQRGPKNGKALLPVTLLMLHRPGEKPYQNVILQNIDELPVSEVIFTGRGDFISDHEELCGRYPYLKIIRMTSDASAGEMVNVGIREAESETVLVFWNDMRLSLSSLNEEIIQKAQREDLVCLVPALNDSEGEAVPNCLLPAFDEKKKLIVYPVRSRQKSSLSLFPFDYCGLYNREVFMRIGGYDKYISSAWWQKMDFGFRIFLWGKKIETAAPFTLNYLGNPPSEDNTPNEDYKYFFLKNLAVRKIQDRFTLPLSAFISFWLNSGEGIWLSWQFFSKIREWVADNRGKFSQEALDMTLLWEWEE